MTITPSGDDLSPGQAARGRGSDERGDDLHAQIAHRLFGWEWRPRHGWYTADGQWCRVVPAYTTDPAATALVWQWVEQQLGLPEWAITFDSWRGKVACRLSRDHGVDTLAQEDGATWREALCRAALALAEAREQGERERGDACPSGS